MGLIGLQLLLAALLLSSGLAFQRLPAKRGVVGQSLGTPITKVRSSSSLNSAQPLLEGLHDPLFNYADFWVKMGMFSILPDAIIHWGHPAAMSTVLIAMGGIGTYAGYQIRAGNGEDTAFFTLGKTIREQHPLIMGLAFFFFFLGGQGGFVLLVQQGKPILESPHALTAVLGMGLLTVQALLPVLAFEKGGAAARTAHTVLGTSTMVALGGHMVTGLNLGLSF